MRKPAAWSRLCAIDNLMKGAAGTALQCANVMMGWDETLGPRVPRTSSDLDVTRSTEHGVLMKSLSVRVPCELAMIVVKVGGGTSLNIDAVVADIVALRAKGTELLLVHGGAQTTNAVAEALGHPPQFVTSETGHVSRRTDRRTLEIFEMVYCGQLNKMWVEKLQTKGVNAVGLSGLDGRVFEGTRKDTLRIRVEGRRMVLRDDWTGTVERSTSTCLKLLIGAGYFPVLTPPGCLDGR